jgi:hypothetical protein
MEASAWFGFGVMSAPFLWVMFLVVIEALWLGHCASKELVGSGITSVLLFLIMFYLMGLFNPFTWIWHNPLEAIMYVIGYVGVGIIYARWVKWKFYVSTWAEKAREHKMNWLNHKGIPGPGVPENLLNDWKNEVNAYRSIFEPLKVWQHKSKFALWVAYWPFSGFFTLINDPFRKLINWVYAYFLEAMQNDANKAAKEFEV